MSILRRGDTIPNFNDEEPTKCQLG
jgi:hypothetical protein